LDLRLRQIEVAKIIGCDEMSLVAWEKGYRTPRINYMGKVVQFLGLNPFTEWDTLAQRLLNHRRARGLSQKAFAAQLGVDPGMLARWERGERAPSGTRVSLLEGILR
jgi:transcriptional regulator with XRE-family HTH domain